MRLRFTRSRCFAALPILSRIGCKRALPNSACGSCRRGRRHRNCERSEAIQGANANTGCSVAGGLLATRLLADANPVDRQLAKEVRRGDRPPGIGGEFRLKGRIAESRPERADRFPDGIVEESAAARCAAMQLGGDEPGLPFEIARVVFPRFDELVRAS